MPGQAEFNPCQWSVFLLPASITNLTINKNVLGVLLNKDMILSYMQVNFDNLKCIKVVFIHATELWVL